MNQIIPRICLAILVILVAAFYLPRLYEQLFLGRVAKTHLFYSPISKQFIYKEKIVGPVPEEVQQKSEEWANSVAYRTENGQWLHRLEFEKLLPFIYYKDMEARGLLPVEIDGHLFTKKEIKAQRRVLELRARVMQEPRTKVYPLFVSQRNQARLVFPKDRFYGNEDGLGFVSALTNKQEEKFSRNVTDALKGAGFNFPVINVFGKFTVLKPFDAGAFLLDSKKKLFRLKREKDALSVVAIPLPNGLDIQYLKVSESRNSAYCGVVVGENNQLFLFSCGDYQFIPLPIRGYDARKMDVKLIFNPLYTTAVFSDKKDIYAVVMNGDFDVVDRFQHRMSCAQISVAQRLSQIIFPFAVVKEKEESGFVDVHFQGSYYGFLGMFCCVFAYIFFVKLWRRKVNKFSAALVFCFGIYGFFVLFCVDVVQSDKMY